MDRTCRRIREAVSAELDGELSPTESARAHEHLDTCEACRDWSRAAWSLSRRAARVPVPPVPDLSGAVLAAARPRRTPTAELLARTTLVSLGLVHLWWTLSGGLVDGSGGSGHPSRDVGAFDLALAVAVLVVAAQPWRAAGLLPMLGVLTVVLAVLVGIDVSAGRTTPAAEALHLLVPLELLVVAWVHRAGGQRGPRAPRPLGLRPRTDQEARHPHAA